MTICQKIEAALGSLNIPIEEDFFGDGADEYITYTIVRDYAAVMADGTPQNEVTQLQIHYFLPRSREYDATRKRIRKLLLEAEFTWPVVTILVEPDNKTRHIVFETEIENDEEIVETDEGTETVATDEGTDADNNEETED